MKVSILLAPRKERGWYKHEVYFEIFSAVAIFGLQERRAASCRLSACIFIILAAQSRQLCVQFHRKCHARDEMHMQMGILGTC